MPDGFTVWPRRPKPPSRVVHIRYTGHPPVAEQLRNQVRTPSGMTVGREGIDGARLWHYAEGFRPAEGAMRAPSRPAGSTRPAPAPLPVKPDTAKATLLTYLHGLQQQGIEIASIAALRTVSHGWYQCLLDLQAAHHLDVRRNDDAQLKWVIIRLAGSGYVISSRLAPAMADIGVAAE